MSSLATTQLPLTWLELLPLELCSRIAQCLYQGTHTDILLPLAQVSQKQSDAVKHTLSQSLTLSSTSDIESWAFVFKGRIKCLDAGMCKSVHLVPLLRSDTLEHATILSTPDFLDAVSHSSCLTSLCINFYAEKASAMDSILTALQTLHLEELQFRCSEYSCSRTQFSLLNETAWLLGRCCPTVTKLDVTCCHIRPSFWWEMVSSFPNLREVVLHERVPDNAVARLQALDSVRIEYVRDGILLAARVGTPVTALVLTTEIDLRSSRSIVVGGVPILNGNQVSMLVSCTRLETLKCRLMPGAEEDLLRLSGSLEDVDLCWKQSEVSTWNHYLLSPSAPSVLRYHSPREGLLLEFVLKNARLKALSFTRVRIDSEELETILECVGDRLERLRVSIAAQEEHPHERMMRVMECVCRCNRELRYLSLDCEVSEEAVATRMGDGDLRKLKGALNILKKRLPLLGTAKIEAFVGVLKESV